jgi:hypothetical protein
MSESAAKIYPECDDIKAIHFKDRLNVSALKKFFGGAFFKKATAYLNADA